MRGKFFFASGLIIGYIFGTRAGRKRYEQIKSVAQSVWHTAPVQQSVDTAKGFALTYTGDVAEAALDAVKKLVRIATAGAQRAEKVADDTVDDVVTVVKQAADSAAASKPAAAKPATKKPAAKSTAKKPASKATPKASS
ncbi:MAG: YtxH domain-containing protein [Microbacteriaceae bacterium]